MKAMDKERGPKVTGAWTALLIALPFGLILAWTQPTAGPSRAELAAVLSRDTGRDVKTADVESVHCDDTGSAVYQCRWRQQQGDAWQDRAAAITASSSGWQVVRERD